MKLDNQICFQIYAAACAVTSLYKPYLKPHGPTYTQYIIFLVLWEKEGLTAGEILKRLMLDSETLSPILKNCISRDISKRVRALLTNVHLSSR